MKELTRIEVIEKLIDDDIDSFENGFREGLTNILTKGFKGYENYTDELLEQEYCERLDPDDEGIEIIEEEYCPYCKGYYHIKEGHSCWEARSGLANPEPEEK